MPDGRGYAVSSVEGRVGLDYFDEGLSASAKYAFKCHRKVEGGKDVVYPVNALGALSRAARDFRKLTPAQPSTPNMARLPRAAATGW